MCQSLLIDPIFLDNHTNICIHYKLVTTTLFIIYTNIDMNRENTSHLANIILAIVWIVELLIILKQQKQLKNLKLQSNLSQVNNNWETNQAWRDLIINNKAKQRYSVRKWQLLMPKSNLRWKYEIVLDWNDYLLYVWDWNKEKIVDGKIFETETDAWNSVVKYWIPMK